jgi:hypothetical protein
MIGAVFLIFAGSLAHYVNNFCPRNKILIALFPVNESVWEHLKMILAPVIVLGIAEYFYYSGCEFPVFFSKMAVFFIVNLTVLSVFYFYYSITRRLILYIDISSFITGIIAGQYMTYVMYSRGYFVRFEIAGIILLLFTTGVFSIFTFYPPKGKIFRELKTGKSGILI